MREGHNGEQAALIHITKNNQYKVIPSQRQPIEKTRQKFPRIAGCVAKGADGGPQAGRGSRGPLVPGLRLSDFAVCEPALRAASATVHRPLGGGLLYAVRYAT